MTRTQFTSPRPGRLSRRAAVAVALAALFPRATAAARRHAPYRWDTSKPIVVENKLGPEWNDAVQAQARAWKRAYPKFRFKVVHKPGRCRWRNGAIVICFQPALSGISAWTKTKSRGRKITAMRIEIRPEHLDAFGAKLICHEFAHALGLEHNDQGGGSCVGGGFFTTDTPGHYDRVSLRLLYGKKGKRWP